MIMSAEEISVRYRQAKDPRAQIRILADLNVCSVSAMRDYIASLGLIVDTSSKRRHGPGGSKKTPLWTPDEDALLIKYRNQNLTCDEISRRMGRKPKSIYTRAFRLGLTRGYKQA